MTIDISPRAKVRLEEAAARSGQELTAYLQTAVEHLLLPDADQIENGVETGWDALTALLESCQVDTGITDLAHQHDHYLHGTPKRGS